MAKLSAYQKKRNFRLTSEPPPGTVGKRNKKKAPSFVIQRHRARALHYDFRLEIEGVLKSWAVPKGPSKNPNVKRLAVMTEDHPLAYGKFAGIIPKGQYGAGKVEIWDKGTYAPLQKPGQKTIKSFKQSQVRSGLLEFELRGKRLKGEWVLFKFGQDKKTWMLKKQKSKD